MTTQEIQRKIELCDKGQGGVMCVLLILEEINTKLAELETRIEKAEGTARHANNIASCLANGIQPD